MQVLHPGLNLIRCPIRVGSEIGTGIAPPVSGDNYAFIDIDSPTGDGRFALRDIAGGTSRYVISVEGVAGEEQLKIWDGAAYPDLASIALNDPGYQFGADNKFRIFNTTTFAHWHALYVNDGLLYISERLASNSAGAIYNPGLNFKFDATSFYLKDQITGLWVKPWIVIVDTVPILQLG